MDYLTYSVGQGDTLWGIAQHFGSTVNDIARFNGIVFPENIQPGQVIKVPVAAVRPPKFYAVRPGDSLWSITERFNLDLNDVIDKNNLNDPNVLYPGQILRLS